MINLSLYPRTKTWLKPAKYWEKEKKIKEEDEDEKTKENKKHQNIEIILIF